MNLGLIVIIKEGRARSFTFQHTIYSYSCCNSNVAVTICGSSPRRGAKLQIVRSISYSCFVSFCLADSRFNLLELGAQRTDLQRGGFQYQPEETPLFVGDLKDQVCRSAGQIHQIDGVLDRPGRAATNLVDPDEQAETLGDHFFLAASSARAPLRMSSIA
jgi:hypothetical protein